MDGLYISDMNIYKVSRTDDVSYDEYEAFVCAAESEDEARMMHPGFGGWDQVCADWVRREERDTLKVEMIGQAACGVTGIILESFNAG